MNSDDPMILSKFKTWILNQVGHWMRSKNYDNYYNHSFKMIFFGVVPFGFCEQKNNIYFYNHRYLVYDMNHDMKNICCRKMIMPLINRSINQGLGTLGWGSWNFIPFPSRFSAFFFLSIILVYGQIIYAANIGLKFISLYTTCFRA